VTGVEVQVLASIGSLYERTIIDTDKQPELFCFLAFIITFSFIRTSAHMIRAQVSWWPGNVQVGGTHIHHLVWGIILLLVMGYIGIGLQPGSPWAELVAVFFGIGAGLTLDEFALWLTLKDVYWEREGRTSIDAVIIAAALACLVLVGFRAWIEAATGVEGYVFHIVGWTGFLSIVFAIVNLTKEKFGVALLSLPLWPVGAVGAFRLARPRSPWAHRLYSPEKQEEARLRFAGRTRRPLPGPLDRWLVQHDARDYPDSNAEEGGASPS
jgi:hypothetical protein